MKAEKHPMSYKVIKDYEDLFLGKRSGHLAEYIYSGDIDYYDKLVREEKNYYLTSAEVSIIKKHKYDIANIIGNDCNVVEIGPGPEYILEKKVIPLLKAFQNLSSYTAIDVNFDYAEQSANIVRNALKNVSCVAYEGDCINFNRIYNEGKICLLFLGSTIANFTTFDIHNIFASFYNSLNKGDYIILAIDCNRSLESIKLAYDNYSMGQLAFNIMRYFSDSFNIEGFDPAAFKFEYEWNDITSAAHLNLIAESEQKFYFNNNKMIVSKGKRYNMFRSIKFQDGFMDEICRIHNFTVKKFFKLDVKTISIYVLQK